MVYLQGMENTIKINGRNYEVVSEATPQDGTLNGQLLAEKGITRELTLTRGRSGFVAWERNGAWRVHRLFR